jgi:hypothetical protein
MSMPLKLIGRDSHLSTKSYGVRILESHILKLLRATHDRPPADVCVARQQDPLGLNSSGITGLTSV